MGQTREKTREHQRDSADVVARGVHQPPLCGENAQRNIDHDAYEFVRTLSEGSYGDVHECVHLASGQTVAIKRFKTAHLEPQVWRLAMREVKVLKALPAHPHVVQLLRAVCSQCSGRLFLVFEIMEGSLLQEMDRHPNGALPAPLMKTVSLQLLQALTHCHDNKVVHRDVKPANVLISGRLIGVTGRSGQQEAVASRSDRGAYGAHDSGSGSSSERVVAKLCDFGFARWLPQRTGIRHHEEYGSGDMSDYVVTRWYRPPEVLVGEPYGTAVDIWSYGCTLAELVTGEPLFPGGSSLDQLWRITRCLGPLPPALTGRLRPDSQLAAVARQTERGRSLAQRLKGADPQLLHLISACLALDPRHRPTARQLLTLPYFADGGLTSRPLTPRSPSPPPPPPRRQATVTCSSAACTVQPAPSITATTTATTTTASNTLPPTGAAPSISAVQGPGCCPSLAPPRVQRDPSPREALSPAALGAQAYTTALDRRQRPHTLNGSHSNNSSSSVTTMDSSAAERRDPTAYVAPKCLSATTARGAALSAGGMDASVSSSGDGATGRCATTGAGVASRLLATAALGGDLALRRRLSLGSFTSRSRGRTHQGVVPGCRPTAARGGPSGALQCHSSLQLSSERCPQNLKPHLHPHQQQSVAQQQQSATQQQRRQHRLQRLVSYTSYTCGEEVEDARDAGDGGDGEGGDGEGGDGEGGDGLPTRRGVPILVSSVSAEAEALVCTIRPSRYTGVGVVVGGGAAKAKMPSVMLLGERESSGGSRARVAGFLDGGVAQSHYHRAEASAQTGEWASPGLYRTSTMPLRRTVVAADESAAVGVTGAGAAGMAAVAPAPALASQMCSSALTSAVAGCGMSSLADSHRIAARWAGITAPVPVPRRRSDRAAPYGSGSGTGAGHDGSVPASALSTSNSQLSVIQSPAGAPSSSSMRPCEAPTSLKLQRLTAAAAAAFGRRCDNGAADPRTERRLPPPPALRPSLPCVTADPLNLYGKLSGSSTAASHSQDPHRHPHTVLLADAGLSALNTTLLSDHTGGHTAVVSTDGLSSTALLGHCTSFRVGAGGGGGGESGVLAGFLGSANRRTEPSRGATAPGATVTSATDQAAPAGPGPRRDNCRVSVESWPKHSLLNAVQEPSGSSGSIRPPSGDAPPVAAAAAAASSLASVIHAARSGACGSAMLWRILAPGGSRSGTGSGSGSGSRGRRRCAGSASRDVDGCLEAVGSGPQIAAEDLACHRQGEAAHGGRTRKGSAGGDLGPGSGRAGAGNMGLVSTTGDRCSLNAGSGGDGGGRDGAKGKAASNVWVSAVKALKRRVRKLKARAMAML